MTSLLRQKNNAGKITPVDKELLRFLVLDNINSNNSETSTNPPDSTNCTGSSVNQSNHKYTDLDSKFLKKFPKTKVRLKFRQNFNP